MESKQINKFLLMFFLSFTLFFSVSNAEIQTGVQYYPYGASFSSTAPSNSPFADYSFQQIYDVSYAYITNPTDETILQFNNMCSYIDNAGYYMEFVQWNYQNYGPWFECVIFKKGDGEFGANFDDSSHKLNVLFYTNKSSFEYYIVGHYSSPRFYSKFSLANYEIQGNYILTSQYDNFYNDPVISYCNTNIKNMTYSDSRWYWDGTYFYEASSSGSDTPSISDDELANIINVFLNSEDFKTYALSGYKDFFVVYNSVAEQYYAYLYKSTLDLGMNYGEFDEEGKFDVTGLSEGEGYRIFWHTGAEGFLEQLWSNVSKLLTPAKYLTFRINPENKKCHYITTYEDKQMIFTTSQQHIVYSSKDITLYVRDGENVIIDVPNSIGKTTLVDSSTNEEYEFVIPETSVSETPWNRFLTIISEIPSNIIKKISEMNGFTVIVNLVSPLLTAIIAIIAVFGSVISLISRAVTFIYTLPTIEPSRALFDVDVAATEGLSFSGNNWGIKFLEGLDMIRNFSWNGLNLWNLFVSFIVAMFAIQVIKYVRKHYHY